MPGTDTRTGSRSTNPYIQKLQNLPSQPRQGENPERFLQQRYDPAQLLRISQQAARDDSFSQQSMANQNRNSEVSRQKELASFSANLQEQSKQNDFNRQVQETSRSSGSGSLAGYSDGIHDYIPQVTGSPYMPQVKHKQVLNPQVAMMREQARIADESARKTFNRDVALADRDRYNQQISSQQNQAHERTQQAAQIAAQERIAMLTGHPGESTWRWF